MACMPDVSIVSHFKGLWTLPSMKTAVGFVKTMLRRTWLPCGVWR